MTVAIVVSPDPADDLQALSYVPNKNLSFCVGKFGSHNSEQLAVSKAPLMIVRQQPVLEILDPLA